MHTKAWNKKFAEVQQSLSSTLIIRDPTTQTLHVNFDPCINEVMREIDVMCQMNIQLPEKAKTIRASRDSLKAKYDSIKVGGELYNNYVACLIILGWSFAASIIWCVFMHGYWKPCMKIDNL